MVGGLGYIGQKLVYSDDKRPNDALALQLKPTKAEPISFFYRETLLQWFSYYYIIGTLLKSASEELIDVG